MITKHKEAFALMYYHCNQCNHHEIIWNSRDGVTPFGIQCSSCGGTATHVNWHLDREARNHKLLYGQKFFRDGTKEEAIDFMERRFKAFHDIGQSVPTEIRDRIIDQIERGENMEFPAGWPYLDIYIGERK